MKNSNEKITVDAMLTQPKVIEAKPCHIMKICDIDKISFEDTGDILLGANSQSITPLGIRLSKEVVMELVSYILSTNEIYHQIKDTQSQ